MTHRFISELNRYNLCTWLLLPLAGLSKYRFDQCGFINSYLTSDGKGIVIHVTVDWLGWPPAMHDNFIRQWKDESGVYYLFAFHHDMLDDVTEYREGQYSAISDKAKIQIYSLSGLKYRYADQRLNLITHAVLCSIDYNQHDMLREKWREIIGDIVDDMPQLLSPPNERHYVNIDSGL